MISWPRFRLVHLLLLIAVFGLALGAGRIIAIRASHEYNAAIQLESKGAFVGWGSTVCGLHNHVSILSFDGEGDNITDRDLECLRMFPRLKHLNLENTKISDSSVPLICGRKHLEWLSVAGTRITIDGFEKLSTLDRLLYLDVSDTDVPIESVIEATRRNPDLVIIPSLAN